MPQISVDEIDRIVAGRHHDPHSILGAHPGPDGVTVRALKPLATTVTVVTSDGSRFPMRHVHEGVFEAVLPPGDVPDYRLAVSYARRGTPSAATAGNGAGAADGAGAGRGADAGDGAGAAAASHETLTDDPYRHLPMLGDIDLHLISEGRHEQLWKVLGAHLKTLPAGAARGAGSAGSQAVGGGQAVGAAPGGAPAPGLAQPVSATPQDPAVHGGAAADETSATQRQPFGINDHAQPGFGPVTGVSFAVWAPNARGVRVVADFNHWDGRGYPMRSLGGSGVWELFVPGAAAGMRYKYQICGPDGAWRVKADPMAQAAEHPPATASVIYASDYTWGDSGWLTARAERNLHREPMSVYEVHIGSWRPGLSYRELADELTEYVTGMGFTHVEFLPVAEHPFGGSWGYQVSSYYAPTARFGRPDDFRYLVDRLHQAGIGVFVDWVPAHFPRDDWALARFDGTPLYEDPDPRRGEHPDWGTYVFNFGRREVRNFLVASALYWLEEFHIDGLRVDAVASMLYLDYSRTDGQWTPNVYGGRENLDAISFLQETNATAYRRAPGITMIAEESTAWPGVTRPVHLGGLGFGFKWNMGWMHDTLAYLSHDPVFRHYHHNELTFSLIYAFSENFVLPLSHDEVVHGKGSLLGKMPGDDWRRFAGLRALLAYMWAHPGKNLLFMGSEFGQGAEWSEQHGLDWWVLDDDYHRGVQQLVRDLNQVYGATPALWQQDSVPEGFAWIDANDAGGNTVSFLRLAQPTTGPLTRPTAGPLAQPTAGPGAAPVTGPLAQAATGPTAAGPAPAGGPAPVRRPRACRGPTATGGDPAAAKGEAVAAGGGAAAPVPGGSGPHGPLSGAPLSGAVPAPDNEPGRGGTVIACIANFSALPHENYRIGLPHAGRWREVINSDAPIYGGSGVGNLGAVEAVPEPWHGKPASATLTVPPLGVLWLAPE